jgi:hypothetical protein
MNALLDRTHPSSICVLCGALLERRTSSGGSAGHACE